jgi:hypothetical protein
LFEEPSDPVGVFLNAPLGNLRNRAAVVDGVEHPPFPRIDRKNQIGVRVASVQQDAGGAWREPFLNQQSPRQTDRDVVQFVAQTLRSARQVRLVAQTFLARRELTEGLQELTDDFLRRHEQEGMVGLPFRVEHLAVLDRTD